MSEPNVEKKRRSKLKIFAYSHTWDKANEVSSKKKVIIVVMNEKGEEKLVCKQLDRMGERESEEERIREGERERERINKFAVECTI